MTTAFRDQQSPRLPDNYPKFVEDVLSGDHKKKKDDQFVASRQGKIGRVIDSPIIGDICIGMIVSTALFITMLAVYILFL